MDVESSRKDCEVNVNREFVRGYRGCRNKQNLGKIVRISKFLVTFVSN